jgi:1,2-phenylacetyl-CoA epoxidase catalytic subunit
MAVASIPVSETPLVLYTLRRADDALILGHRLSEWCGHAPMLEEDMALANMGLDLLGQARELFSYAAKVEGKGNDEDKFAYLPTSGSIAIFFCWNSRTAISPAPWCGSFSTLYSPISIGVR